MSKPRPRIRVAIIGVGNCASSLVQGVEFYKNAPENEEVPGLMHVNLGGYHVGDIEFSAAFDINRTKVGKDLSEAIFAEPNNTFRFCEAPPLGVKVHRGMTHDGLGKYLKPVIQKASGAADDIVQILKDTRTDVVINYLPVGSEVATKWYVEQVLEAGCALVNCIPVFIASQRYWQKRFEARRLPVIGDDVKSQVGAAITHRVLANLFRERGVRLDRTYQLNFGGNTDLLNMLERERLGARRVAPLYGSVDPAVHRPVAPADHYRADLSYLGTYAEDRQKALQRLFIEPARRLPQRRFLIGGAQYPQIFPWTDNIYFVRHLPPQEHPAFFSSSRLTLNVTRRAMAEMGYCPLGRLFEAAVCGAPILSDAWEGLDWFFTPGEEILTAETTEEAHAAIETSDEELQRLARAARETRFSARPMRRQYLERYESLGNGRIPNRKQGRNICEGEYNLRRTPDDLLKLHKIRPATREAPHPQAHAANLVIEELMTLAALDSLRGEWSQLWDQSPTATVFQSPEWLLAWRRNFPAGDLWTLAVRRRGRLAGLAPLFVYSDDGSPRKLFLLGAGATDYLDVLAAPPDAPFVACALLQHIVANADRWDIAEFLQLSDGSPLLGAPSLEPFERQCDVQDVCPVLSLPAGATRLADCLPAPQARKWEYCRRRDAKAGAVRVERAEAENFEELFDHLLRLHQSRWSRRDLPGVLADAAVCNFHREAAAALLRRGRLRLYGLRIDGRTIASLYGFHHRRRTFYYLGGFDPAFKQLSPGMLLVGNAIEQALQEGSRAFDFLRGREPYKYAWGAADRPTYALRLKSMPDTAKRSPACLHAP